MSPFISICIPAYKNAGYLKTLLDSIAMQKYRDFDVVVSDDSPDAEVEFLCKTYSANFPLIYKRNLPAKGSPANWNEGIHMATGSWIKIMHDDDWFADENSLAVFAKAATAHPGTKFIFSGFRNYENGRIKELSILAPFYEQQLKRSPLILFKKNYIGHPSTTLIKNEPGEWYDEKIKWVVDIEFYIRRLKNENFFAIKEPLVNIGIGDEQVTKKAFRNIKVEIPENLYLLQKLGTGILKNVIVYDYYWRLLRNLGIREAETISIHNNGEEMPAAIRRMLNFQRCFPLSLLKFGPVSKILMFVSYLFK